MLTAEMGQSEGQLSDFDIYARLVRPLAVAVARALPRCFEIADLIQTGNLALHCAIAARDPLLPDAAFAWYLKRRIKGAMIDSVKGAPYREAMHEEIDQAWNVIAMPSADLDEKLDAITLVARVRELIALLPAAQRAVIEMRYACFGSIEMRSQAECARALGISQAMVSKHERAAIDWIRQQLAGEERGVERGDKAA